MGLSIDGNRMIISYTGNVLVTRLEADYFCTITAKVVD